MRRYDFGEIETFLAHVLSEIGPDRFSSMKLMELEKTVRTFDPAHKLPGKTVLRGAIHRFRIHRWPTTAPKKANRR